VIRIFCLLVAGVAVCTADTRLGKPLVLTRPVSVSALMAAPDASVGKVVQVKGRVTEVCEKMGCWMQLTDGKSAVRIKVVDGEIVFPGSAIGRSAVAEGTLSRIELSKEQAIARAKHEAEEQGRKFNPASVKSGTTIYQIQGTGAILLD
jgi:hypothetical protein